MYLVRDCRLTRQAPSTSRVMRLNDSADVLAESTVSLVSTLDEVVDA